MVLGVMTLRVERKAADNLDLTAGILSRCLEDQDSLNR